MQVKTTQIIRSKVCVSRLRNNQGFNALHNTKVQAQAKKLIELAKTVK